MISFFDQQVYIWRFAVIHVPAFRRSGCVRPASQISADWYHFNSLCGHVNGARVAALRVAHSRFECDPDAWLFELHPSDSRFLCRAEHSL